MSDGDTGGAVVMPFDDTDTWVLVGMITASFTCTEAQDEFCSGPFVMLRVSSYLPWIREVMSGPTPSLGDCDGCTRFLPNGVQEVIRNCGSKEVYKVDEDTFHLLSVTPPENQTGRQAQQDFGGGILMGGIVLLLCGAFYFYK